MNCTLHVLATWYGGEHDDFWVRSFEYMSLDVMNINELICIKN